MEDEEKTNRILIGIAVIAGIIICAFWKAQSWAVVFDWCFKWLGWILGGFILAVPVFFFLSYWAQVSGKSMNIGDALEDAEKRFKHVESEMNALHIRFDIVTRKTEDSIFALTELIKLVKKDSPTAALQETEKAEKEITKSAW